MNKQIRKWIKSIRRLILLNLPYKWRDHLLRNYLNIPLTLPENMKIKFAETGEEFNQAFQLIQECYSEIGISEHQTRLRVTKYHALPSSQVVIVTFNNEVIATLTHILDNSLGLPIESNWSLDSYRKEGELLAELSSLAIKNQWRHHHGLFFYITKFCLEYATNILGVDRWVMVTHPNAAHFYESILCFKPISKEVHTCGYVKEAKGWAQSLNLATLKETFYQIYYDKPLSKNIYQLYFGDQLFFQKNPSLQVIKNTMNKDYFLNLFNNETDVLEKLDHYDKKVITSYYTDLVPEMNFAKKVDLESYRRQRCLTCFSAMIACNHRIFPVKVLNVSSGGLKILSKNKLDEDHNILISIQTETMGTIKVEAKVAWNQYDKLYGLELIQSPQQWRAWTIALEQEASEKFNRVA